MTTIGTDVFDIEIEGEPFQQVWSAIKDTSSFNWKTMGNKHDAFAVKQYGQELAHVNQPTTREKGRLSYEDEGSLTPNEVKEKKAKSKQQKVAGQGPYESGFDSLSSVFAGISTYSNQAPELNKFDFENATHNHAKEANPPGFDFAFEEPAPVATRPSMPVPMPQQKTFDLDDLLSGISSKPAGLPVQDILTNDLFGFSSSSSTTQQPKQQQQQWYEPFNTATSAPTQQQQPAKPK